MMRTLSYVEAFNEALRQEMARDRDIVIFGENIQDGLRGETRGLHATFGSNRVIDMPISEQAMTGIGTGAALAGARPVIHFQVASLIFVAFDQLVNQAAKLPLMLGGQRHIPATYLIMGTGAAGGRAGQHSDNPYPFLLHGGIKSVCPATPYDAKGLVITALREDDPVAIFAPGGCLRQTGDVPDEPYAIPLGQGAIRREGTDVTVAAVGHLVAQAEAVAEELAGEGIGVEVWDPRSLLPLDHDGIAASVGKTGRLVLYDDSNRTCGFAARSFADLKAPIKRVTRANVTIPASATIEPETLPSPQRLADAIRVVAGWSA